MSIVEPFSQAEHKCDRDRPLFSSDLENFGPLLSGKFCLPSPDKASDIGESGTAPWPTYGSDGIPATEDIEEIDEFECTTPVGSPQRRL